MINIYSLSQGGEREDQDSQKSLFKDIETKLHQEKSKHSFNTLLTDRDLKILQFCSEMKFASLEALFEKFFALRIDGDPASSVSWTRKRLSQLEKASFLKGVYSFSERQRYYTGTMKAYFALKQVCTSQYLVRPTVGFDQRTFFHDKTVLLMRINFEKSHQCQNWISERQIRGAKELNDWFGAGYVPDGIVHSSNGVRSAFELEIAVKSKKRYSDKIKRYIKLLRNSNRSLIDLVHFVCARDSVLEILKTETRLYPDLFLIEPLSKYELLGKTNITNKKGN